MLISGGRDGGAIYRHNGGNYPLYETTSGALDDTRNRTDSATDPRRIGDVYIEANFGIIEINWERGVVASSIVGLNGQTALNVEVAMGDLPGR